MTVLRKMPEFKQTSTGDDFGVGVVMLAFGLLTLALIIFGNKQFLSDWIGVLCGVILVPTCILGGIGIFKSGFKKNQEKKLWIAAASTAEIAIVNREAEVRYEDDYYKYGPFWRMYFEMTPSQSVAAPGETVVMAHVTPSLYQNYLKQDTVRIFYSPENPLVFLLEEEL